MTISAQQLADNISNYTDASILAQLMFDNRISLQELISLAGGDFAKKIRDEVRTILESTYEPKEWETCCNNQYKESYNDYLKMFPNGVHATEAKEKYESSPSREELDKARPIWEKVDKKKEESLQDYINQNPNSPFIKAAEDLLARIRMSVLIDPEIIKFENDLRKARTSDETKNVVNNYFQNHPSQKNDIYTLLSQDHNIIHYKSIKTLRDNRLLDPMRLLNIGIDPNFIKSIDHDIPEFTIRGKKELSSISRPSTEVYFWGIPASGKTTAISAILCAANLGTVVRSIVYDNKSQGYEYMNKLSEIFRKDNLNPVSFLPPGTKVESTFEMGLTMTDNDNKVHTYTFVDLSGEILQSMYKTDAGIETSDDEKQALSNLDLLFKPNGNSRIHFVVLEYSDKPLIVGGLRVDSMLNSALNYIESKNIFSNGTEAIYLLITKVDRMSDVTEKTDDIEMAVKLKDYLLKNYNGFYNRLNVLCEKNNINKGVVGVLPLSLGKVCFKNFCIFNPYYAERVIKEAILIHPRPKVWWERLWEIIKKKLS